MYSLESVIEGGYKDVIIGNPAVDFNELSLFFAFSD